MKKLYAELDAELYDKKEKLGLNLFRRFFHISRQRMVNSAISTIFQPGMDIYDFGCGTSNWNLSKLPVIGIDINKNMLEYAVRKGRISKYIISDIAKIELKKSSVDIILLADILEHLEDYEALIQKLWFFLRPGGWLLINVPFDSRVSLWRPLFKILCFLEGDVLGNPYYRNRCGHINSFTPSSIRKLLEKNNFEIVCQKSNLRLSFLTIAKKNSYKKSKIVKEWDQFWRSNSLLHKLINFGRHRYNKLFIKLLEEKINRNSILIELGCGTSSSILPLHSKVLRIIGVDFSEQALKISRQNANKFEAHNVSYIRDDITEGNLKENNYDVVWSQGLLEHFEDFEKILSEHIRICKSKGWIVASIPSKYSYLFCWYLLSKLPFLKWIWPWMEQSFFTKKEVQEIVKKIENIEEYRIYCPKFNLSGLIILEIKKK